MQYLYESWCAAGEQWTRSTVYMNITNSTASIRRGVKRWMCRSEIVKLLGEEAAESVISHKYSSKKLFESEVRDHPDAPGSEAACLNEPGCCTHACLTMR